MHHLRNTLLVLTLFAAISGGSYVFIKTQPKNSKLSSVGSTASLSQTAAQEKETERKVTSSDGLKTLTMKITTNDNQNTYAFYVSGQTEPFYTQTFATNSYSMGLSDNAWSPGERYIFLERNGGGEKTDLVFKADGTVFASGRKYLDAGQLFKDRVTDYTFAGSTGWADSSLLIVETTKADGSPGPSFWMELPGGNYIQLSSHQ